MSESWRSSEVLEVDKPDILSGNTALSSFSSVKSTFWVYQRRSNEFPLQGVFTDTRMKPPRVNDDRSSSRSEAEPELQQLLAEHVHQRFMIHPKLLSDTVI